MNMQDETLLPETEAGPEVSVIMAADGDGAGIAALVESHLAVLEARGAPYEMLLLYSDAEAGMRAAVAELAEHPHLTVIAPRPWTGPDEAITQGIRRAKGATVVTLPGWSELAPEALGTLIDSLGPEVDMATGQRSQELPATQKPRVALAHGLVRLLFKKGFEDIFCRTRAGRREMFAKISDLGVRQHFLPLVAVSEGYRVREVPVAPAQNAVIPVLHRLRPSSHVSALFDLFSLYIALKFLKRPLRFFGSIGLPMILFGTLVTTWLVVARLGFGIPLADRPALVFAVMVLVLGIQIVALGLVGEIIIFSSSRRMRGYEIDKILRGRPSE